MSVTQKAELGIMVPGEPGQKIFARPHHNQ
jgi:hypothetical protein